MARRSERVTVRLTPNEEDWIINKAEKAGVSKSRFMRKVVLGELSQAEVPFYQKNHRMKFNNGITHEEMRKVLRGDMSNAQNNLNQIARKLNSGRVIDEKDREKLDTIQDELNNIARVIVMALR